MFKQAIGVYRKALLISPNFTEVYYNMGNALKSVIFEKPDYDLQKIITLILKKKSVVRPRNIARAAISLLKLDPKLRKKLQQAKSSNLSQNLTEVITDLSELPLLLELMSVCPLPDLDLEALLTNLRSAILSNILDTPDASPELLKFQSALALQCFTNEYIYNHSAEEEKKLRTLAKTVSTALINEEQPSPQAVLALASYKALYK